VPLNRAAKQETPVQTGAPQVSTPATEKFAFTDVDLELLKQSDLFDERLGKEGVVYKDAATTAYVERLGQAVIAGEPVPERVVWRFRILRDPLANAFALPNGSIYVNTGLIAKLDSEAQLVGVLAHEVTHVRNRHTYHAHRSYRKKMVAINIIAAVGTLNPYGGALGMSISALATALPVVTYATIIGYSRDLERDADREAVRSLARIGYDPQEMAGAFRSLQKDYDGEQVKLFYADHPELKDRIEAVERIVSAERLQKGSKPHAGAEYLIAMERSLRHDVRLSIDAGKFRTATAVAKRLVEIDSRSSENVYLLAESYRALGPRAPELTAAELTNNAKKRLTKKRNKLTLEEEEAELMRTSAGALNLQQNETRAAELYARALELDRANVKAYRGLGLLYERAKKPAEAVAAYRKYLDAQADAPDRARIERRVAALSSAPTN
jgi:predicted Zn-dependent protease